MRAILFRRTVQWVLILAVVITATIPLRALGAGECTEGLTNYWKFEEQGAAIFSDSVGINDASCSSSTCPAAATGKIGNGLAFSGGHGLTVNAAPPFNWNSTQSFTIEFWMKTAPGSTCAGNQVAVGRNVDTDHLHWWVGCWEGGKAGFVLKDNNGVVSVLKGSGSVTDGKWHHIAAVRNGATDEVSLFLDSVKTASAVQNYTAGFDSASAPLTIGWLNLDSGYPFEGFIDEMGVYNVALPASIITQHYTDGTAGLGLGYCGCSSPVRVMPLGDSITLGRNNTALEASGPYEPPANSLAGYRKELFLSLVKSGYLVDFVGSRKSGSALLTTPMWDVSHQGEVNMQGFTAQDMAANVYNYLSANPADVVLLHIGTNNLNNSPYDPSADIVSTILDEIFRFDKNITVLLALIIDPNTNVSSSLRAVYQQYNQNVAAMANSRIANGDRIILVDQEHALKYPDDMYDDWHPNDGGYSKMAKTWLGALTRVLPVCNAFKPQINSIPVTSAVEGKSYRYGVSAAGYPSPIFSLPVAPSGMQINSSSGLIDWMPPASGAFKVTVQAVNPSGSDTQDFSINVSGPPPCPLGLAHYWKLDETAGSVFTDFFGNADATCTGCPSAVSGIVNGAQHFTAADQLDVPDDNTFDWGVNSSFSFEFWMKADSGSNCSGNQVAIGRDDHASALQWWAGCWSGGKPAFVVQDKTGTLAVLTGTTLLTDGNWHQIAGVRNAATDELSLYVDSIKEDSVVKNFAAGFDSSGAAINIGWLNLDQGYHFLGALDEVAIYNKALAASDVQQNYSNGQQGKGLCALTGSDPVITSTPVTAAEVGKLYTYDVNATGTPAPQFSLTTSPQGMTIDIGSGMIKWTPSAQGNVDVTVTASNGTGTPATQSFTISVGASAIPKITSTAVTAGLAGAPYEYDVVATGTPAPVFSLGVKPLGMTIDSATGVIKWTPAKSGSFSASVRASNSLGSATQNFTIKVNAAPKITSAPVLYGIIGKPYQYSVKVSGSPVPTLSLVTSPDGMTLSSMGLLKWTPGSAGTFDVVIKADNGIGTPDTQSFTVTTGEYVAPQITSTPVASVLLGQSYQYQVTTTSFPPAVLKLTAKPKGMTIDPNTGMISWTPDKSGKFPVTLLAKNGLKTATQKFTITVNAEPKITSAPKTQSPTGKTYYYNVKATGFPKPALTLLASPPGMTLSATGTITWKPAAAGTFDVSVQAANGIGTPAVQTFSLEIGAPVAPVINSAPVTSAVVGTAYEYDVLAGGFPAPTFVLLRKPIGMKIDAITGVITWTPSTKGNFNVSVKASNAFGTAAVQNFIISVTAP